MNNQDFEHVLCKYRSKWKFTCMLSGLKCNKPCNSEQISQDEAGVIDSQMVTDYKCPICRFNLFKQKRPEIFENKVRYFFTFKCPICSIIYKNNEHLLPAFFNFTHDYYKLKDECFTTIRSKTYNKKRGWIRINKIGWITINRLPLFPVRLLKYEDKRIINMSLKLLKKDADSDYLIIKNSMDFVNLLNQFVKDSHGYMGRHSLKTEKRIFYLRKQGFSSVKYKPNEKLREISKNEEYN